MIRASLVVLCLFFAAPSQAQEPCSSILSRMVSTRPCLDDAGAATTVLQYDQDKFAKSGHDAAAMQESAEHPELLPPPPPVHPDKVVKP